MPGREEDAEDLGKLRDCGTITSQGTVKEFETWDMCEYQI